MNRRKFITGLASLPLIGKLVPLAEPSSPGLETGTEIQFVQDFAPPDKWLGGDVTVAGLRVDHALRSIQVWNSIEEVDVTQWGDTVRRVKPGRPILQIRMELLDEPDIMDFINAVLQPGVVTELVYESVVRTVMIRDIWYRQAGSSFMTATVEMTQLA